MVVCSIVYIAALYLPSIHFKQTDKEDRIDTDALVDHMIVRPTCHTFSQWRYCTVMAVISCKNKSGQSCLKTMLFEVKY